MTPLQVACFVALSAVLVAGCSCDAHRPLPEVLDAAPVDSVFIDVIPRDATLPCGRGVALRWLGAPLDVGIRVDHVYSASVGVGALLLWIENPPTGEAPAFLLGFLPTIDAPAVSVVSSGTLISPDFLVAQDSGALVIDMQDTPGALSFEWALFDETGAGPLQETSWSLPSGVNVNTSVPCNGVAALPMLLYRDDLAVGAALVQWDSPSTAMVSNFTFPADGSLGVWPRYLEVPPDLEACVATGAITYMLVRPGRVGPLRLLRWASRRLLELPHALGTTDALDGTAVIDSEGPLFFSFDASEPWTVRAFRPTAGGDTIELDAQSLDAFPEPPTVVGAVVLTDGTVMLFYDNGGILSTIGFMGERFGTPSVITDFTCASDSSSYAQGRQTVWPAFCYPNDGRARLAMFELCGGGS